MSLKRRLGRLIAKLRKTPTPPPFVPTIQSALQNGVKVLKGSDPDGAARDARILMAAALGVDVSRLTLMLQDPITHDTDQAFMNLVAQRVLRKPISHILGKRMFYGRDFAVTPDVLDPRGDTETLIEAALAVPFENVLDLGTGSGCILVTLLAERPQSTGTATDISGAALGVAEQNAKTHGVLDRCALEESDWFSAVGGTFDLIVSNPPYIAANEMAGLSAEVHHEPRMALTDESDGLSCYRIIAAQAGAYLNAGGWLMVEIGPTQGAAVVAMFGQAGLVDVQIRHDLDGRDRCIVGQKPL